jgi:hypothetical protein
VSKQYGPFYERDFERLAYKRGSRNPTFGYAEQIERLRVALYNGDNVTLFHRGRWPWGTPEPHEYASCGSHLEPDE